MGPTKVVAKKKRAGLASGGQRRRVFKRDGNRCVKCGSTERLEIDHIVPRSRGGGNEESNLQTLCHGCNLAKGNSMPGDLLASARY